MLLLMMLLPVVVVIQCLLRVCFCTKNTREKFTVTSTAVVRKNSQIFSLFVDENYVFNILCFSQITDANHVKPKLILCQ